MAKSPNNVMKKSGNAVVYKVITALVMLCLGLMALNWVENYYGLQGWRVLDPLRGVIIGVSFGLCALCIFLLAVWKSPICRAVMPWLSFTFAIAGMTGISMLAEEKYGFSLLFFLWALILVQYIIYQLYRWEFFLFSLPTATAGFLFYQLRTGFSMSVRYSFPLFLTVISIIGVVLIAANASRNGGCIVTKHSKFRLFSKTYNPFLHYLVAALWVVCIIAAFILGGEFAFYCMFAAIAVEFIAAVYYTFQLN